MLLLTNLRTYVLLRIVFISIPDDEDGCWKQYNGDEPASQNYVHPNSHCNSWNTERPQQSNDSATSELWRVTGEDLPSLPHVAGDSRILEPSPAHPPRH